MDKIDRRIFLMGVAGLSSVLVSVALFQIAYICTLIFNTKAYGIFATGAAFGFSGALICTSALGILLYYHAKQFLTGKRIPDHS